MPMRFIQPVDRGQYIMMNSLDDTVPENHPLRLIDSVIEQIVRDNPSEFTTDRVESDPGRPAFAPQTMLKLFLYGYLINCRASRKLEAETQRNIELMWLLGKLSPDHWVIAHYRRVHGDQIKTVTKAFRQFLHTHGYIKGERVAIDGTKMKANACREMLSTEKIEKRLDHLDEQMEEYLSKLAENDHRDDLDEELDALDGSIPPDRHLREKVIALQKQIDELTRNKETLNDSNKNYLSPADPEASMMKSRDGKIPAYNVQSVVDDAHHMIATTEVLTDRADNGALAVMVKSLQDEIGVIPQIVAADAGYYAPDLIEQVESQSKATCYIAAPERERDSSAITFQYDASTDCVTCSQGKPLVLLHKNKLKKKSLANVYRGTQCVGCQLRSQCTSSKYGRIVHRYHNQDWRDRYRERMKKEASRAIVALRKSLVEHPFGTIKLWGGKLPLLLRGKAKVSTEINLYATAYNFKRLLNCTIRETLKSQIASASWKLA